MSENVARIAVLESAIHIIIISERLVTTWDFLWRVSLMGPPLQPSLK